MVNMDTMTPFGADEYGVDATPMLQGEWRTLIGGGLGDGVVGDPDATTLKVTATGSDATVDVSAGAISIQGHLGVTTGSTNLDVGSTGTPPAAGQTRIDLICARLDPVAQTIGLVVLAGSPATTGAVAPSMTRAAGGVWDVPLARVTRVGNVAITNAMITSYRTLCSPTTYFGGTTDLPGDAPDGSVAFRFSDILVRVLSGGSMQWRSILDPPWTTLTMASGYTSAGRAPAYRVHSGHLELRGEVKRTTGAEFPASTWLTIASVPSSLVSGLTVSNWPRVPVAMSDFIGAGELRLTNGGLIQLAKSSGATEHSRAQTQAWLDGARLPLE